MSDKETELNQVVVEHDLQDEEHVVDHIAEPSDSAYQSQRYTPVVFSRHVLLVTMILISTAWKSCLQNRPSLKC